jgi:hypothetical protein
VLTWVIFIAPLWVELKVALGAAHGHRHVGDEDLDGDHQHGLGLGRLTLPGMIEEPGSLAGKISS